MKTLFSKLMVTLMALTLVFGSTMTAFAAENEKTVEGNDVISEEGQSFPVTVRFTKNIDTENEGVDDSENKIYRIDIQYEELHYSFEAANIKWDSDNGYYNVELDRSDRSHNIMVTNRSNTGLVMTTELRAERLEEDPSVLQGAHIELSVDNASVYSEPWSKFQHTVISGDAITHERTLEWGASHLDPYGDKAAISKIQLSVIPDSQFYAEVIDTFDKLQFATLSLKFADSKPAENTGNE